MLFLDDEFVHKFTESVYIIPSGVVEITHISKVFYTFPHTYSRIYSSWFESHIELLLLKKFFLSKWL